MRFRLYDEARIIIDEAEDDNYDEFLISLNFYEANSCYDFSRLPGLDSLSPQVGFKELRYLMALPDKNALIQLLTLYTKKSRFKSFFAIY